MDVNYKGFEWRDTARGSWVRDVDELETMYTALAKLYSASGRGFFHMTGHLSLRVGVPEGQSAASVGDKLDKALSQAWLALRFRHPTIASQVTLDPLTNKFVKEYALSSEGWLEKTFVRVSTGQTGAEWAIDDPPVPPLPTLNVVTPPSSDEGVVLRDLVFRSPHDIVDGVGALMLFDNYVRLAAEAFELGDAYESPSLQDPRLLENLSPPYRVAAAVPPEPSDFIKQRLESLAEADKLAASTPAEMALLPYKKGALAPGVHKRIEIKLSPEETSELSAACKALGATVTHVFHAAIALALRDLQPRTDSPRPVQYVGYLLRNERGRCVPPYHDHRHAAGVYHSISGDKLVVKMNVPSHTDVASTGIAGEEEKEEFLRIVAQMRDFYTTVRDDEQHYALAPHLIAKGIPELPAGGEQPTTIPPPSDTPSATISSMGRIDGVIAHQHGSIEIYNPWVTGEELRNSLGLFLGTFRGELALSAAYNDAWHGYDETFGFVRSCLDIVRSGLGVGV
ncbi:uncharacterized protein DNG_05817 [Cephalotrichum gorgonifer]|uniref:Condensation domain-containing protein n=1 Tax=Cephalotrichum gorgonifer TaxID=2041049 RepID=A0AAE8SVU0_9PEZI|nr:uncharacterized protein DNG_05817 [Cephalotrichum gorgonifer]